MRILAACSTCQRQYEVRDLRPGEHFHCACGAIATVPQDGQIHRHALHCAACGAARQGQAEACGFCNTLYSAKDRERTTTCPHCFARIADHARFCDHCGVGIAAIRLAGETTTLTCPVCGPEIHLHHRPLPGAAAGVDECPQCGGMWLEADRFRSLIAEAQRTPLPEVDGKPASPAERPRQSGPLYRPCSTCQQMMNRQNYGGTSGVIIDVCKDHGTWLDADELNHILGWVRVGGLQRSQRQQEEEQRVQKRRHQERTAASAMLPGDSALPSRSSPVETALEGLVDLIGSLFSRR